MSETPQDGRDWLKRLLARVPHSGPGDVIAANIGEGAQNVAVGKFILQNNVRIGALVVPVRFILVLLLVAAVVAGVVWYLSVPGQMPPNTYNIAVAEFGQLGKDGRVSRSTDGSTLSLWMFNQMRLEAANWPQDRPFEFWHDSLGLLRKRTLIGVIATEDQAAALARRIGAQMVIYGALDPNQDPAVFVPQFYVARVVSETSEIIGGQNLGVPIAYVAPIKFGETETGDYFDSQLKPRARALVWFARGLALDVQGRFEEALGIFEEAGQRLKPWPADQGQEVLYVFMGREAMFLARNANDKAGRFKSHDEALAYAQARFEEAKAMNATYDRAHLWLGNVYAEKAQTILASRQLEPGNLELVRTWLDQAAAEYQQAIRDAPSPNSVVAVRAQLSLGMLDYFRAASYLLTADNASAEPYYRSAIDKILETLRLVNKDEYRILAQMYQTLGAAYYAQGHASLSDKGKSLELWGKAIEYYDRCSAQGKAYVYDDFIKSLIQNHCAPEKQDVIRARDKLKSGS